MLFESASTRARSSLILLSNAVSFALSSAFVALSASSLLVIATSLALSSAFVALSASSLLVITALNSTSVAFRAFTRDSKAACVVSTVSTRLEMPTLEVAPQYTSPSTRTFCVFKTISASVPTLSTYTSPSSLATVTRFSVESCATGCAGRRKAKNAVSRPGSGGRGGEREIVRSFDDGRWRHAPSVVRARRSSPRRKRSRTRGSIAPRAAFDARGVDGVVGHRSRGDERRCEGFAARSTSTRKKRAVRDRAASNA